MPIQVTKKAAELAERSGIDLKEVKGSGKGNRILLSDIEALIEETDEGEIIEVVDDEEDDDWGDDEGEDAEVVESAPAAEDDDDDWGDEAEVVEDEPKAGPKKGSYKTSLENDEKEEGEALADSFSKEEKEKSPKAEKPKKKKKKAEPKPVEKEPEFSGETHTLYFEWVSVEPDANSYKPLKPQLSPMNVGVRIDVPEEYVIEIAKLDKENEMVFLSPEGMAYCASLLAQATLGNKKEAKDDPDPENWDSEEAADDKMDDWAEGEGLDGDEGWD